MNTKIYKLVCEKTPNIVYIGITKTSLLLRLFHHFQQSILAPDENSNKSLWVLENWRILKIEEIEEVNSRDDARKREAFFVLDYIQKGFNVLNDTYKQVCVYENDGNLIDICTSIENLSSKYRLHRTVIHRSLNSLKPIKGLRLIRYNPSNFKNKIVEYVKEIRGRVVFQYDLNNNFIKEWSNIRQAGLSVNGKKSTGIIGCAKGRLKTAYGYIWKYDKINQNKL